jgi:hypothetical protein
MFNISIRIPINIQQQPNMNKGLYNQFLGTQIKMHIS